MVYTKQFRDTISFDSIQIEEQIGIPNFSFQTNIDKEEEKKIYPLKPSMKYGQEFIFVNPNVWNFIQKYFKAGKK